MFLPASILLLLFTFSCDESLPPRDNPNDVFDGSVRVVYVHDWNENGLRFYAEVINTFDETIEDTAILRGQLFVSLPRAANTSRTLAFTVDSLISYRMYDRLSNQFRIDPGDTMRFMLRWDFIDDRGRYIPDYEFAYYPDETCALRELAYEEFIVVSGRLAISRRLGELALAETVFPLCFKRPWFPAHVCSKAPEDCKPRPTGKAR